jgi:hypothetical protein
VNLMRIPDPDVLAWAAETDHILLTHDVMTVPGHAHARVAAGQPMPGVFVVAGMAVGDAIGDLALLDACSEPAEWRDLVWFLPL